MRMNRGRIMRKRIIMIIIRRIMGMILLRIEEKNDI